MVTHTLYVDREVSSTERHTVCCFYYVLLQVLSW